MLHFSSSGAISMVETVCFAALLHEEGRREEQSAQRCDLPTLIQLKKASIFEKSRVLLLALVSRWGNQVELGKSCRKQPTPN
jgi:hypothetical protein